MAGQSTITDARREGLLRGLRQLTREQLKRVLETPRDSLCLDEYNYHQGCFCPLAAAVGLPEWIREPTQEKVQAILALGGLSILNTRGLEGSYYQHPNRYEDLREAVFDVLIEKVG